MTIKNNSEFLQPEHLAELSALFDKTCAALAISTVGEAHAEQRTRLASILLQLYDLRQLGPDEVIQAARRIMRQTDVVAGRDPTDQAAVAFETPLSS